MLGLHCKMGRHSGTTMCKYWDNYLICWAVYWLFYWHVSIMTHCCATVTTFKRFTERLIHVHFMLLRTSKQPCRRYFSYEFMSTVTHQLQLWRKTSTKIVYYTLEYSKVIPKEVWTFSLRANNAFSFFMAFACHNIASYRLKISLCNIIPKVSYCVRLDYSIDNLQLQYD